MADIRVFCLVDGEPTSRAFPVEIAFDDTVAGLRDLIKTEMTPGFDDIDANNLTIWQVSVPVTEDDKVPIKLDGLDEKKKLMPTDDRSDVFIEKPSKKTVHIIVQRPPRGNLRCFAH